MTILPKKKTTKDKNEVEKPEHSSSTSSAETVHHGRNRARNSPPRWLPSEEAVPHDPGGVPYPILNEEFAEYDPHEAVPPTVNIKRRHRSPPHSTHSRRKHKDRHSDTRHHSESASRHHGESSSRHHNDTRLNTERLPSSASSSSSAIASEDLNNTGYNSGDEYTAPEYPDNVLELEAFFERTMKESRGLVIKKMGEDGACLFRAVADQVYGDQEMHSVVRKHCIDYMAKNRDHFSPYVTEDYSTYLNRKREDSCHGNHVEIQAMAEMYNRPIEVYQYSMQPINTFHGAYKTENEPIRVSYHGNTHYNSLVDPYKATVGVGLGIPDKPGAADKSLMDNAIKKSEDSHFERCMLEDKLRETDWELTQETIEEQVARESYLQWLRDNDKNTKRSSKQSSASATCSSAPSANWWDNMSSPSRSPQADCSKSSRSPRSRSAMSSPHNSPHRVDLGDVVNAKSPKLTETPEIPGTSLTNTKDESPAEGAVGELPMSIPVFSETSSIMDTPAAFGLSEWGEDDILAQVIAQSQQEYLDRLKKNHTSHKSPFS